MPDKITIENDQVRLSDGQRTAAVVKVPEFSQAICHHTVRGMQPQPLADNLKWRIDCRTTSIAVVELKPELRWIRWISDDSPVPYGPEATMQDHKLATPYVVLFVPFRRGRVVHRVQLFYRNRPLEGLDGPGGTLYWPNLLNVSPHANGCLAWCCTQYLDVRAARDFNAGLQTVINHLWGGQFNRSSEAHEGQSTFSKAVADQVDPRVTNVARWQAASEADPDFILSVDWQSTGKSVRDVLQRELARQRVKPAPGTVEDLMTLTLKQRGARRRRK